MRRVVVASTALLAMLGVAVVATYLLLFAAVADRAARAAPGDTALYLSAYLQPSAAQQANLFALIGRLPGFGDPASLEEKVDEVAGRLLRQARIDYAADVRPWLGTQVAVALSRGEGSSVPGAVIIVAVKDAAAARTVLPRLLESQRLALTPDSYRGHALMTSHGTSYALLEDLLLVGSTPERLHAALDANDDLSPSLADRPAFAAAMRELPSDHLASIYLDLPRALGLGTTRTAAGYTAGAAALTAEDDGLHLDGAAPFTASGASDAARHAFALAAKRTTLTDWMSRTTVAEAVAQGVSEWFVELEASIGAAPASTPALDALNQLRTIAAIGLGVNLDRDLLPLLDGETGLALQSLGPDGADGQLLLRPSDPHAAHDALERMRSALADRGSQVALSQVAGSTITSIAIPGIATVAYAELDGVVVLGLDAADVAAALQARAGDAALAGDDRYAAPFELTGAHAGAEAWGDLPGLVDALAGSFDLDTELRDILHQIGELAISASANDDRLEIHGVLTVPVR